MLSINKAIYVEGTFCYRDYVCQVSKLQHMYVIGLVLLSVLETTKKSGCIKFKSKILKQINPNLGGPSRGSFLPPMLQRDYEFEKRYFHLNSHAYLASRIYDFFGDLCFNRKFEQEKKSLYENISKSIFVDTYHLLFVIIVTECDVLPPSTEFSSLHHKTMVVLRV